MILQDGLPAKERDGEDTSLAPSTIGKGGLRQWIYPREIKGPRTARRRAVAWILMGLYLGLPWIRLGGEPLLKLDLAGRKLILAGHWFWAQDLALLLPAILGSAVAVFLVTARFGRVWCGWACPQTVFLQFLIDPIERLVEGRASVRRARDRGPFTWDLAWRKTVKNLLFALVGLGLGATALSYVRGTDAVLHALANPGEGARADLLFVAGFGLVFFWIFAWFREQACVLVCPYARFQSVLADARTSQVTYDQARGEPRGRGKAGARQGLGSCVDCMQCVQVCPTGIDIRMGSQLECLGCTRCMDACDRTMEARGWPKGLIRYNSLDSMSGKGEPRVYGRLAAYALLSALLFCVSGALLLARAPVGMDATRQGRDPYVRAGADSVRNTFTLHLRNRLASSAVATLEVVGTDGSRIAATNWDGRRFAIAGGQLLTLPLEAVLPVSALKRGRLDVRLVLRTGDIREDVPLTLAGPWGTDG
jgi:cytochrome c oxidase accessory protein FixG